MNISIIYVYFVKVGLKGTKARGSALDAILDEVPKA